MTITKAKSSELIEALYLTSTFPFMENVPSYLCWTTEVSFEKTLANEIKNGELYLMKEKVTFGMFSLTTSPSEFVKDLNLPSCLYIRYYTVFKLVNIQEATNEMLLFSQNFAIENNFQHIAFELNESIPIANQVVLDNNFSFMPNKTFSCQDQQFNLYLKSL